ncbi:unnamed protein product [Fasciola hepatica]|uniref:Uncharacterized protein n=1 Tax=Fasciola hepatica TaxID=6192 RepID=A0ABC9HG17_FASHE
MPANSCNFCISTRGNLLRNKLVTRVRNDATSKKLLQMRQLDLKMCLDIYDRVETTFNQKGHLTEHSGTTELNAVTRGPVRRLQVACKGLFANVTVDRKCHLLLKEPGASATILSEPYVDEAAVKGSTSSLQMWAGTEMDVTGVMKLEVQKPEE